MSRLRDADLDGQATPPQPHPPSGRNGRVPPGSGNSGRHPGLGRLLTGVGLCALVLLLGVLAKVGPVARLDLRADEHVAAALVRAGLSPDVVTVGGTVGVLLVAIFVALARTGRKAA